jgi:hypothetical protein
MVALAFVDPLRCFRYRAALSAPGSEMNAAEAVLAVWLVVLDD